ncbi:hypothetical protein NADFUDRAFT_83860 [Nadsonia fulvescens var. elongata DSM 6958]|uniref:Uncharacterized protein n=1 Tax=Nadsonia fulvescens var. elongata DSM 6958 TaxID=857566 RepID=A0A1E3PG29_9ASCO|nr:hypothetical protein NADFUDRAFT_83860 [Nadsonia fulvescens var. elongata DSM 6958]
MKASDKLFKWELDKTSLRRGILSNPSLLDKNNSSLGTWLRGSNNESDQASFKLFSIKLKYILNSLEGTKMFLTILLRDENT